MLSIVVDLSNLSEVTYKAKKYIQNSLQILDIKLCILFSNKCFRVVTENKTNTIFLILQKELTIDNELISSASDIYTKRVGADLLQFYPILKRRR